MTHELVRRYSGNPILAKSDISYLVETVHNAAVVKHGDEYIIEYGVTSSLFRMQLCKFGAKGYALITPCLLLTRNWTYAAAVEQVRFTIQVRGFSRTGVTGRIGILLPRMPIGTHAELLCCDHWSF